MGNGGIYSREKQLHYYIIEQERSGTEAGDINFPQVIFEENNAKEKHHALMVKIKKCHSYHAWTPYMNRWY